MNTQNNVHLHEENGVWTAWLGEDIAAATKIKTFANHDEALAYWDSLPQTASGNAPRKHEHKFEVTDTDEFGREFGYCQICLCDMQDLRNGKGIQFYHTHKFSRGVMNTLKQFRKLAKEFSDDTAMEKAIRKEHNQ